MILSGHTRNVHKIVILKDGRILSTSVDDQTFRILIRESVNLFNPQILETALDKIWNPDTLAVRIIVTQNTSPFTFILSDNQVVTKSKNNNFLYLIK